MFGWLGKVSVGKGLRGANPCRCEVAAHVWDPSPKVQGREEWARRGSSGLVNPTLTYTYKGTH